MGLFSRSYMKPGKGIDPDAPPKRAFFRFFDIIGRKFWKFIKINMLYALTIIPTFIIVLYLSGYLTNSAAVSLGGGDQNMALYFDVLFRTVITYLFVVFWGMGPATAGITYILRNFAREEHAWLWSDFKDAVKGNFKQSVIVFAVDVILMLVMYFAYEIYSNMGGMISNLRYVIVILAILYTFMHFYIYPMMVTFKLSLKDIYRNAVLFALGRLPQNIFVAAVLILIHIGGTVAVLAVGNMLAVIIMLLLETVFLLSFSAFFVNFNVYPNMKKYMMDAAENMEEKAAKDAEE